LVVFGSKLAGFLRPGVQVPSANACACGGLAALVMHVGRTSEMREEAFSVALAIASGASLVAMRVLFVRTKDPHRAKVQAFVWPPLIGAIAGAVADVWTHVGSWSVALSIFGTELGGGVAETVLIAILSAFAGLVGTALILPQVRALERARASAEEADARVSMVAERLALATWATALALAGIAFVVARARELDGMRVLVAVAALGFLAQCARVRRARSGVVSAASAPYR
jgi:hypothetical protein